MNKAETRLLMGNRLQEVRKEAKLSREELGKKVGLSRSTIERMEAGTAPIELSDWINIYTACNANPRHDFFMFTNPEIVDLMKEVIASNGLPTSKPGYKENRKKAFNLCTAVLDTCSLEELTTVTYLLSGEYGGDRYAVLQTFLLYCQLELEKRDMCCGVAVNAYEDAEAKGKLSEIKIKPNLPYIKRARERGKNAHREGKATYI